MSISYKFNCFSTRDILTFTRVLISEDGQVSYERRAQHTDSDVQIRKEER